MQKIAIIIPCYKEAGRLKQNSFIEFLQAHPDVDIFFVDDGSPDSTPAILSFIHTPLPFQVNIISLSINKGKANAIRVGLLAANSKADYTHIGYLDADLSTDITEFYRLFGLMKQGNADFVFGSRVKLLCTTIERSFFRHITGRAIATIIDLKFKLGIYDTQCGAKWFKQELINLICSDPFKTNWLFDVEIFLRIKKALPGAKGMEIVLNKWKDSGGSAINVLHFPIVVKDIIVLLCSYQKP